MAKANVVRKNTLGIKGILNVDNENNRVVVEIEDGEAWAFCLMISMAQMSPYLLAKVLKSLNCDLSKRRKPSGNFSSKEVYTIGTTRDI